MILHLEKNPPNYCSHCGKFFENAKQLANHYNQLANHYNQLGTEYFGAIDRELDDDPYHYDFETFEWICEGTKLTVEYKGDWRPPKGQGKTLEFTKRS